MGFEARVHGPAYYDEVWRVLAELGSHRSCRLGTRSNCLFNTLRRLLFDSSTSLSLFIFRPLPIANSRIARLRPNSLPAIIFQGRHVVSRAGNPLLAPPSLRNHPSHAHLIKHYTPPQQPLPPTTSPRHLCHPERLVCVSACTKRQTLSGIINALSAI